ncbi:endopeptidase La [Salisediminibacterium selenitireducens]|uniref:Lon protease n=1 Tax=Bacillus selenitireducens (strain ATCC 700615 / DSM 15326 / MLS10) TaxID=439292 RepID=D6XSZ3_BACIE|nr:endopeptidase La [Salisediminibacterium selenitireducens]ADH98929.1 ATP-dependent protease La [[Bacillus] selenitireducens MLS10]
MSEENKTLPLLPLRGLIVFPTMVLHLDVGRDRSIQALETAMVDNHEVFLTTQREVSTDEPSREELHEIGAVAKVNQMLKLPNGTIRVLVEGLHRAKIEDFRELEKHSEADISFVDERQEATVEEQALMRNLLDQFEEYLKLSKNITRETFESVADIVEPGRMADIVTSHLPLKVPQKQEVIEEFDVTKRLNLVLKTLKNEREVLGLERKIGQQVKRSMEKSQKEYYLREQMKAIQKELGEKESKESEIDDMRDRIFKAEMPEAVEEKALKELKRYEKMPPSSAESSVIRNYIEWLVVVPWHEVTEDVLDIHRSEKILDEDHYGLEKVKERVLEYLAVQELTNELKGPILCLTGPPGVGKTSLARSVARSLDRKFVRMSLGGVRDEAEIRGHRRTYVGAMPGRIIQGMKKAGTMNPVFLLDEIDKLVHDFRGDPSASLLEVLDPEQNNTFSDHFIEEPYDLSKVMFITTANNIGAIPAPLRDRMEIIHIPGYTEVEKKEIAKRYLLPKQIKEHGLSKGKLQVKDEAILKVVRRYTREAGVRNLERELAKICRKAAKKIVSGEKKRVIVTEKTIEELLGRPTFRYGKAETKDQIGTATGLAYTAAGGDTLNIEVSLYPGKGKLLLTGKLGDVMKESAQAAFSYIRSKSKELNIDPQFNEKNDIHIHVPEGAVPKDGPSAGITIATALISALTERPVRREVGMTGEITLRGRVLPIGGLKEKSMSAHRAGLTHIIIPEENEKDLEDIPDSVRDDLTFIPVAHLDEVLKHALAGGKES